MEGGRNNILLVLSILDGRHFNPQRDPNEKMFVEAKLSSEFLVTDTVPITSNPRFDSELAFELNKKTFRLHRLKKTPLKIRCFTINTKTDKKEVMGNLVMDLRAASDINKESKWYGLLNCVFSKHRPELLMALYVENELKRQEELEPEDHNSILSKIRPKVQDSHSPAKALVKNHTDEILTQIIKAKDKPTENTSEIITPVLNELEGNYQIGPEDVLNEKYLFSITLAFAENLDCLETEKSNKEYYFFYSMFGNEVSTEKFRDLSKPKFPVERASVRIRANPKYLAMYFKQLDSFQVILCCGDNSIAFTNLSLKAFSEIEYFSNPNPVEGVFELFPENPSIKTSTLNPAIGISITLKSESQDSIMLSKDIALSAIHLNSDSSESQDISSPEKQKSIQSGEEYSPFFEKSTRSNTTIDDSSITNSKIYPPDIRNKNLKPHRFSFTIDIRSFNLADDQKQFRCFFRYNYKFFSTTAPIETYPIAASPGEDVIIPHGYCSFNIITAPCKLEISFREVPLMLEVMELLKANGKELKSLSGIGKLSLDSLNQAAKVSYTNDEGRVGFRQTSSLKLPMISLEGPVLGTLYIVMTLDELGEIDQRVEVKQETNYEPEIPVIPPLDESKGTKPKVLTGNDVLKAALELELWKEQQEVLFRKALKEKEADHLQALTSEWKKRDTDREVFVRKSLAENNQLEEKLKRALADVELRERQLMAKESELDRNLKQFFNSVAKTESEAKDSVRRIKTECDYRLDLEKQKNLNLEKELKKLRDKNSDLEKRLSEKEDIIQQVQNKIKGLPEYQLQADMTVIHAEKNELVKRLEGALTAKTRYKEQWGKALKQISILQQQLNSVERNELTQKVNELEKDKLKETARKEERRIINEKQTLSEIKDEVMQMKQKLSLVKESNEINNLVTSNTNLMPTSYASQLQNSITCSEVSSQKDPLAFLEGLLSEKQLLLESGVYKEDDMVIKVLDRHIKQATIEGKKPS